MEKRIQEFIADYIPKRITKETRYKLQYELENHIYDRIDYYREIGYTEEESLEKALKDFGDDKEAKEQIRKNLENIHIPWSLANFFAKSIPISIAIILIGGTLLHIFLFEFETIINMIIIPLIIWLVIIALKRVKRIHHIVKSIIAIILVVPYFMGLFWAYFLWTPTFQLKLDNEEVINFYSKFYKSADLKGYTLSPSDIGEPLDADFFEMGEDTAFGNDQRSTFIFEYSPTDYKKIKEAHNKYIEPFPGYSYVYPLFGFNFTNAGEIYDPEGVNDNCYLIGSNDETHEIAIIVSTYTIPTFDEYYIKEICGWQYFYFLTKF